jgi:flagellar hook-associated protein 1 FlgK
MMQFQKSYSASCRLLTTLDEILDKLINGTGIAGR